MTSSPTNDCPGYLGRTKCFQPTREINFYLPISNESDNKHRLACSWITPPKEDHNTSSNHNNNKTNSTSCCNSSRSTLLHLDTIHPSLNKIDTNKDVVIICHGFLSWRNQILLSNLASNLSKSLSCHTLRFDFSGNGHSSGDWSCNAFQSEYDDVCRVYDFVTNMMKCNVSCIIGHSQGSTAVLTHAAMMDSSTSTSSTRMNPKPYYVNLAGRNIKQSYDQFEDKICKMLPKNKVDEWYSTGQISLGIKGGRNFIITKQDVMSRCQQDTSCIISKIKTCKVLTIHGDNDTTVPIDNAKNAHDLIVNHTLKIIHGANHNFNGLLYMDEIVTTIANFVHSHK